MTLKTLINQACRRVLLTCAAAGSCFAITGGSAMAQGATVYANPQTGAITKDPTPGAHPLTLSPATQNAASTSHEGLVAVQESDGSVTLDLQGRFRSPLVGSVDANGQPRVQHLPNLPPTTVQGMPR
jgi:hypothetical protein